MKRRIPQRELKHVNREFKRLMNPKGHLAFADVTDFDVGFVMALVNAHRAKDKGLKRKLQAFGK
jgi:hypothetical protein